MWIRDNILVAWQLGVTSNNIHNSWDVFLSMAWINDMNLLTKDISGCISVGLRRIFYINAPSPSVPLAAGDWGWRRGTWDAVTKKGGSHCGDLCGDFERGGSHCGDLGGDFEPLSHCGDLPRNLQTCPTTFLIKISSFNLPMFSGNSLKPSVIFEQNFIKSQK